MIWEYRIDSDLSVTEMNELGKEEWELVAVTVEKWTDERKGEDHTITYYYFKRAIRIQTPV